MIVIPKDINLAKGTKELIEFFNALEKSLEYPSCEGYTDQKRILLFAEQQLIKWGKV